MMLLIRASFLPAVSHLKPVLRVGDRAQGGWQSGHDQSLMGVSVRVLGIRLALLSSKSHDKHGNANGEFSVEINSGKMI
jgi:hypothetical protein